MGTGRFQPIVVLRAAACAIALLAACTGNASVPDARSGADPAGALTAKYAALSNELAHNAFQRPIHLDSTEGKDNVGGEIFAILNFPFATAAGVLDKPDYWCDILFLHLNNKYCRPVTANGATVLHLAVGAKGEQAVKDAYPVNFSYRVTTKTADYVQVNLEAVDGPLSTHNYKIVLEAIPADDNRTFIHFSYAYSFGIVGRLAMQAYLNTVARDKVGFTVVPGDNVHGEPRPVGGMRGAVERNTMRYYLAIEAFLGALSAPPGSRVEKSLRDWFAATEAYPRQLHEMDQNQYLAMKRNEYVRQKTVMN